MEESHFDVLVIGAGAAGLNTALEIAATGRSVGVVEAKDRAGGRILTVLEGGKPLDLGAEFIHGDLPLTKALFKKFGKEYDTIRGSSWESRNGTLHKQGEFLKNSEVVQQKLAAIKSDKPVEAFLAEDLPGEKHADDRRSIRNYVNGYYAADTARASTVAFREEFFKQEGEQYRPSGGYGGLVDSMEEACKQHGVSFFYSEPVRLVDWQKGRVMVATDKQTFTSAKLVITVSTGVLQNGGIRFAPEVPKLKERANNLGFGHVVKVVLQFKSAFWKDASFTSRPDLSDLNFLFSSEEIPTWWTHLPKQDAVITGWLGGPQAASLRTLSHGEIENKALRSLARIFNISGRMLEPHFVDMHYYNWSSDPYVCGAYSYEVVGGTPVINELLKPVAGTLFLAGEALHAGQQIGTVEAALASGRDAALRLLPLF